MKQIRRREPIRNHPLYTRWFTILELARSEGVAPEWDHKIDPRAFERFVADVGAVPSDKHRLLKRDTTQPIGPANFCWVEKMVVKLPEETKAEYELRQFQTYYAQDPDRYHRKMLRTRYDISGDDYDRMFDEQKGLCAICGEPEQLTKKGRLRRMCVDHRHSDGLVRALLCRKCNSGLGLFYDSSRLLRAAAAYVDRFPPAALKGTAK